jgi:RNA polymerase sigma-70 factor (ECF subfamily)
MYTGGEETMLLKTLKAEGFAFKNLPPERGLCRGPRRFLRLKCRQVSAFEITLEGMPGLFAKASDNAVDACAKASDKAVEERCQKLLHEGALRQALELLMEAYGTSVYTFCCNMVHDTNTAADILQTTFVQAFSKLPMFEKRVSFHAWLLAIARNRAVDHLRTLKRRAKLSVRADKIPNATDANLLADQLIHKQQTLRVLEQCLEEFRSQTKDASILNTLILRFRDDLPYEQISKKLGSPTVTLRVRVSRILPKLKQCIESKGGRA